jgi:ATP-dependent Clp protease adapter protein ClpS
MDNLNKKIFESLINFDIEEAKKPTRQKTKPNLDNIIPNQFDQPLVPSNGGDVNNDAESDIPQSSPKFNRASKDSTLRKSANIRPNDQMKDMLSRMRDIEADPDDPGYPEQSMDIQPKVNTQNLPAIVNHALTQGGFLNPEWHTVANLPGNMAQGIRTVGRRLFKAFTRTPTDNIIMIGNVMGMGPNTAREVNAVASWLSNTGQKISTGDIDFKNFIPGYKADIRLYKAAGARFMLVKDDFGQYIYTWPEGDSVDGGNIAIRENEVLDRPPVTIPKEIELDKPGGFNVMLLNDPVTPAEVVVEALMSVLGLSQQGAIKRMMRAHRGGWHVVATYASADIAESVANKLTNHCHHNTNYDHYRTNPNVPKYPRGPGGYQGDWPTQFEVMEA